MAIMRVRDENGNVIDIPALVGPPGKDYVLTKSDKAEIAAQAAELVGSSDSSQNPNQSAGLTSTEKNAILTILDGVIVETSKQSVIAQALATLKQLWSGGEVFVSQNGTTLTLENVTAITTITQNGTTLALA